MEKRIAGVVAGLARLVAKRCIEKDTAVEIEAKLPTSNIKLELWTLN